MKAQGLPAPASPAPHAEPAAPPPAAEPSPRLDEALRGMLQPRLSAGGDVRRHRHASPTHAHHNPGAPALQMRLAATESADEADATLEADDPPELADDAGTRLQASADTKRESPPRLVPHGPAPQPQHARVTREGERRQRSHQAELNGDDEEEERGQPAADAARPWDMRPVPGRSGGAAHPRVAGVAAVSRSAPLRTDGLPAYPGQANAFVSALGWGLAAMVVAIVLALLAAAFGPRDADTPRGGSGDAGDADSRHEQQREPADEVRTAS